MTVKKTVKQHFASVKWLTQHTMSEEQLRQLVRDKMERAERMQLRAKAQEERKLYA